MHRLAFASILALCLAARPALAQDDFGGLQIKPGEVIYVTDPAGVTVRGPLKALSPSTLTIDGHEFKPTPGLTIERRGDSIWNGALIGAAVGAGFAGVLAALGDCIAPQCTGRPGASLLTPVIVYSAAGAWFDWRSQGRTVVYRGNRPSARVTPQLMPGWRALRFDVSF
jgi:hypothetical protein